MVLKRVWTIDDEKHFIKLKPFIDVIIVVPITSAGSYHFVCGLPSDLNISKSFSNRDEKGQLRHKLNRAQAEKSKYSVKCKVSVFSTYQKILKEKRRISLRGDQKDGEVHFHFNVNPKILTHPLKMRIKLVATSITKRLRVSAALYKEISSVDAEKQLMKSFLKHIFTEDSEEKTEETSEIKSESNIELNKDTIHRQYQRHVLPKEQTGQILLQELFNQGNFAKDSKNDNFQVTETGAFKDLIKHKSKEELNNTLIETAKNKYQKVKVILVENPLKNDTFHEVEEESTVLSDFQIQLLNYEVLPRSINVGKWVQRFNSKIFGHNLNEVIRLCSSSPEPQLIVVKDTNNFIFGGFLKNGLFLKNSYNKDSTMNFPSIFHENFCLTNYDIPSGYKEIGDESESCVFTFHDSVDNLVKFKTCPKSKNRMYRMINKKGIGMGGENLAFFVDHTLQTGGSYESSTYGNKILASQEIYKIKAFEVWSLQSKFHRS